MITEECKKEIEEYLKIKNYFKINSAVWNIKDQYCKNEFYIDIVIQADRSYENRLIYEYKQNPEKMDKYFLEYIGHILKKYDLKEFKICDVLNDGTTHRTYKSTDWKFKNIELTNEK